MDNKQPGEHNAAEDQVEASGSRRDFLRKTAAGVGAAVAAGASTRAFTAEQVDIAGA